MWSNMFISMLNMLLTFRQHQSIRWLRLASDPAHTPGLELAFLLLFTSRRGPWTWAWTALVPWPSLQPTSAVCATRPKSQALASPSAAVLSHLADVGLPSQTKPNQQSESFSSPQKNYRRSFHSKKKKIVVVQFYSSNSKICGTYMVDLGCHVKFVSQFHLTVKFHSIVLATPNSLLARLVWAPFCRA